MLLAVMGVALTVCPSRALKHFNRWLGKLPYKTKVVVAGNHEVGLSEHSRKTIQKQLSNAIYLQDKAVTLCGARSLTPQAVSC